MTLIVFIFVSLVLSLGSLLLLLRVIGIIENSLKRSIDRLEGRFITRINLAEDRIRTEIQERLRSDG